MPSCPVCQKEFSSYSTFFQHKSLCDAQKNAEEAERRKREKELEESQRIVIPEEEQEKIRNWKFNARECKPGNVLNSVEDPRFYHHIEGGLGSDGVLVIERTEGDVVIVKPVAEAEGEIFSSLLFRKLVEKVTMSREGEGKEEEEGGKNKSGEGEEKSGATRLPSLLLQVPKIRPLYCKSPEFQKFCTKLKLLEKYKEGGANESYMNRISQKSFLLVIEFMRGESVYSVGAEKFHDKWNEKTLAGVGVVIAFDMFINNWDRFPVPQLWENEGNPGNLMFTTSSTKVTEGGGEEQKESCCSNSAATAVVAIDQSTTSIAHEGMKKKYLTKVHQMIEEPDFSWFSPYIQRLCGGGKPSPPPSDDKIKLQVTFGFQQVLEWVAQHWEETETLVKETAQVAEETMKDAAKSQSSESYLSNVQERVKGYEQFVLEVMRLVGRVKQE